MTIDWVEIAITILTTGFFSLIGFVWRFSHKVSVLERDVSALLQRVKECRIECDKINDKIYAMTQDRSNLMSKQTYHSIEDSKEISRMRAMQEYDRTRKHDP